MKKVASSRNLISKLTRKTKMPSSSRMPAKSFRQRDRTESRNAESYYSDDEGDDNMVDQQYDMFRDMFANGHDPRVISHTMISAGLDPAVVIPREVLQQRSRSRSHASRRPGGTVTRNRNGKRGPVHPNRNDTIRSNSHNFDSPNTMLQSGYSYSERKNSDMYRRNNSYASVDDRNGSFNEVGMTASRYEAVPVNSAPQSVVSTSGDMRSSHYQPSPHIQNPHQDRLVASEMRPTSQYHPNASVSGYHNNESMATSQNWKRNNDFQVVQRNQMGNHHPQQPTADNATVYSNDAMSALTASRRNRGFIRRERSNRSPGVIENLPQLTSGRNLPQNVPESSSYVPPPQSEIGSVASKTKHTFIRRNRLSGNSHATRQPVLYNRKPRMTQAVVDRTPASPQAIRKPKKQRSSATMPSSQSLTSTNHSGSLPKDNRRSQRPTRVTANAPLAPERKKNGIPLKLYPYDSDVYKPFKVMQILGHYPTEIIEALESAGLDPCVLYKGVDVNRHPNEPIKLQGAQTDKWELKYSKRYFMHYYQNKSTGETLWKDEVDRIAEQVKGQDPSRNEALMPHHITDDDI